MKIRRIALTLFALGLFTGPVVAAHADDYVGSNTTVRSSSGPAVLGSNVSRSSGLAVTGGDVAELAVIGLAAVGAGTVLVRRSRRTA
ncbi:MAG: hypothetical protein QOG03_2106 [Actinomycetota bacterium]|nr:hypothetical protein [Actinomycetota bacterium]